MSGRRADWLLTHRIAGEGEPVLFLNGGLMTFVSWDPVAGPLEAAFRIVRCDLRGQLLSPGPPPRDLRDHVPDLVRLLDALGIQRTHVVGTSLGALVGLLFAASCPGRVASIAAVTATERVTPEVWRAVRPVLAACRAAARGADGRAVFDLLRPGMFSDAYQTANAAMLDERAGQIGRLPRAWFGGLAGLLASLEGLDLRPELRRIQCPAVVVAAGRDRTFPMERSRALAAAMSGARLVVVPGSGHALVVEAPTRLLAVLRAFLVHACLEEERHGAGVRRRVPPVEVREAPRPHRPRDR